MAADENPIKSHAKPYPTFGKLESKDPRFDKLISPSAKMEKLAEGFEWCEGPVWNKEGGYLLFSDIPRNSLMKWKDGEGVTLFMKPSGYTGIVPIPRAKNPARMPTRSIRKAGSRSANMATAGFRSSPKTAASGRWPTTTRANGSTARTTSCFKSNGDLYFTDPPYGLPQHDDDPRRELDFCGVYRLSKDGQLTLLTKEMTRPNGIAFSPDEKTLYVSNSDGPRARPFGWHSTCSPTARSSKGKVFFDASDWAKAGKVGKPDGMKVDKDGNLFATGPGGVHVFAPDGTHLGTINPDSGDPVSNCAWGDDGSTLYMTVNHAIARIKTNTKGAGW